MYLDPPKFTQNLFATEAKGNFFLILDLETSGCAGVQKDTDGNYFCGEDVFDILEIAGILLNENYEELCRFTAPLERLTFNIDEDTIKFHNDNGYLERYHPSEKLHPQVVEDSILSLLKNAIGEDIPDYDYNNDFKIILAGRSVWFDRAFISKVMPRLAIKLAHYMVDVSAIKPILRKETGVKTLGDLQSTHVALEDCECVVRDIMSLQLLSKLVPDDEETCLLTRLNNLGVR